MILIYCAFWLYYTFIGLPKQPKLIVITGAIAVGKTTFARKLYEHLLVNGKHVMLLEEVSRKLGDELKIFYEDVENRAFWFQDKLIQAYSDEMKKIKECGYSYDYIIMDRSHLDTIIFTHMNIKEHDLLSYLDKKLRKIEFPFDVIKIIHLRPSFDTVLTRFYTRKRCDEDNLSEEYLSEVYLKYGKIHDFYKSYENFDIFENDCGIGEYHSYIRDLNM